MGQGNKKEVKVDLPNKGKRNVVGGAGGIGFIGGAGLKAAKGAFTLIKNILKNKKTVSKVPKSKPVDYKGPNPAHNTGAGGNSYPR